MPLLAAIPGWVLDLLVMLALKFGLPWLILNSVKIPWIGPFVAKLLTPDVIKAIEDFLESLKGAKTQVKLAKMDAHFKRRNARRLVVAKLKSKNKLEPIVV